MYICGIFLSLLVAGISISELGLLMSRADGMEWNDELLYPLHRNFPFRVDCNVSLLGIMGILLKNVNYGYLYISTTFEADMHTFHM